MLRTLRPARRGRGGFTLLELLVVVAIVGTLGGAALVAYDGLDSRGAKAQATFNISAVDRAVRTFKVVNGKYPDRFDAAVVQGTTLTNADTATAGGFFAGLHSNLEGTDADVKTADGKLAFHALTAKQATALANVGITTVRMIDSTLTNASTNIPNRTFDDPTRGNGTAVTLAAGVVVPIVEAKNHGNTTSTRLKDISGLDSTKGHVVVALALGNNSTIVSDDVSANSANLSEAPFYTDVAKTEYGRFFVLFHVATDSNDDGTITDAETFTNAKFIGVIDPKGDWLDEEYAESTGQKI